MASHDIYFCKLYYLEDLELGDVVRCRTGCLWLNPDRTHAHLGNASGLEATFLGSDNGEDFFLFDHKHGTIRHVIDHHNEATRWEILGESN